MYNTRTISFVAVLISAAAFLSGCQSNAETGALIGAGGGAILGQAIGGDTKGTLIGAGAGAVGGYVIGGQMDKKAETKSRQDVTASKQSSSTAAQSGEVATVTITNSNGSTTPVTLHKEGSDWVGPRGEHYNHLPTEAEMKPVYGF